jgi:hypothetical protein
MAALLVHICSVLFLNSDRPHRTAVANSSMRVTVHSRALCEEHGEEFLRMHLASRSRAHQASLAYVVPCHETMSERRAMIGRVAVARRPSPCSPTHRSPCRTPTPISPCGRTSYAPLAFLRSALVPTGYPMSEQRCCMCDVIPPTRPPAAAPQPRPGSDPASDPRDRSWTCTGVRGP